jgi:hypothetical protein
VTRAQPTALCALVTAQVRELIEHGLTVSDTAVWLGVHEYAVTSVCLCRVTEHVRHEHPRCTKHVLDVERRLRA